MESSGQTKNCDARRLPLKRPMTGPAHLVSSRKLRVSHVRGALKTAPQQNSGLLLKLHVCGIRSNVILLQLLSHVDLARQVVGKFRFISDESRP